MSLPDWDMCPVCDRIIVDSEFDEDWRMCVECALITDEEEAGYGN